MAKEWFAHDYGTRNKKKLAALLHEEGARGYGLFWIIVEMLYEDSNKYMELEEFTYLAIKKESGEEMEYIKAFIKRCLEVYTVFFVHRTKYFSTTRVIENSRLRKGISTKRSEAGIKSGESRRMKRTIVEQTGTSVQQNRTKLNREEEIREEEIIRERENTDTTPSLFKIEDCFTIALRDDRWVRQNNTNEDELGEFMKLLISRGQYTKNPADFKSHFANWKRSGKLNGVETDSNLVPVKKMIS